jgi:protein gp37
VGAKTGIEWTDHTFNAWIGCTKVSEGCRNCYAARDNERWKWNGGVWGPGALRQVTSTNNWAQPLKWAKAARAAGVREKVFCNSLSDTFDAEAPKTARQGLWMLVGDTYDALDWQFVTKRPERIQEVMSEDGLNDGFFELCKCWLLTTTEDQDAANKRVPLILDVPAAVHGVSCEPLLGPLDLRQWLGLECRHEDAYSEWETNATICRQCENASLLDWVICGGESGPGARPMHPDWARSLRDQCAAAGVPFFFKQWGEFLPAMQDGAVQKRGTSTSEVLNCSDDPVRVGKHAAGALLDGCEWKQFPEAR